MPSDEELTEIYSKVDRRVLYNYIVGEDGSPCGSASVIVNQLRGIGINQDQIPYHTELYKKIICDEVDYIILVDDFVGTGTQFISYWLRPQFVCSITGNLLSLQEINEEFPSVKFYYMALVATEFGIENIRKNVPEINVFAAEILNSEYKVFDDNSIFWNNINERDFFEQCFNRINQRSNILQAEGFGKQQLAIAFNHCIPDNTLGLFRWDKNGWIPLIGRN